MTIIILLINIMGNKTTKEKDFGRLFATLRKKSGLSQNELAQRIEMNPTHLSKIEQGKRNPLRRKNLKRIILILGLSSDEERQLYEAAGYAPESYNSLVYSYPSRKDKEIEVPDKTLKESTLDFENPTVRLIAEIINDSSIRVSERRNIEEQISSFAKWLREQAKSKI